MSRFMEKAEFSESAQMLGGFLNEGFDKDGSSQEVKLTDLAAAGIPYNCREYADWLHAYGLRMWRAGKVWMRFTRAPSTPADMQALFDKLTPEDCKWPLTCDLPWHGTPRP